MLSFSSKEKRFFIFVTAPRRYGFAVRNPVDGGATVGAASPVSKATFSRFTAGRFRADALPALDLPAPPVLCVDFFVAVLVLDWLLLAIGYLSGGFAFIRRLVRRHSCRAITLHHPRTERGELFDTLGRACMVRLETAGFRCKAQCQGNVEFLKSAHLPVKPLHRARAQAV